jgi:hypothetical protein
MEDQQHLAVHGGPSQIGGLSTYGHGEPAASKFFAVCQAPTRSLYLEKRGHHKISSSWWVLIQGQIFLIKFPFRESRFDIYVRF